MLVIDNGDAIRGIAEVAAQLDFIVNGYVGTTATQLADGQIGSTEGDLYLSGADGTVVTSTTVVNTDSVARTFTLYLKPSGGTSRAISPISLDLGVGHSFYTDGQRMTVLDKLGQVLSTWAVDDTPVDGETDKPISSNWAFGHVAAADPHTGYLLESLLDAHSMVMAVSDNTPVVLAVAASRFVGRKASGNIAAMTGAEAIALLSGANLDVGAYDVRGATLTADGLTSGRVVFAGASGLLSDDADFTFSVDTLTVAKIAATSFTGDITMSSADVLIGANKLKTTDVYIIQADVANLDIRRIVDDTPGGLYLEHLNIYGNIPFRTNASYISAKNTDNNYLAFKARDNTVGLVEIARLQGAADPEFQIGNNGNALRGSYAGYLGFYGTTPQAKPTGVAVSAGGIHAALVTLGLIAGP